MNEPKPKSLDEKEALISELEEMNRQIQDFKFQIVAYERSKTSDKGLFASFNNYGETPESRREFAGFPIAKNPDGFSRAQIAQAKTVFNVFASSYSESFKDRREHWEGQLKEAEKRKMVILERLLQRGVNIPAEIATPLTDGVIGEVKSTVEKSNAPLSDADKLSAVQKQIEDLKRQAEILTNRVAYNKKYPTPESIPVPEDGQALPSDEDYPHILDIHKAIERAVADGKYINALDTKAENDKRINYLKHLLENSPEIKNVIDANKKSGVDKIYISFSEDQALFLRSLQDNQEFSRFETGFSSTLSNEPETKGVIKYTDYDDSEMSQLRYNHDVLAYAESTLKSQSDQLPKWLIEVKGEFERLFSEKVNGAAELNE